MGKIGKQIIVEKLGKNSLEVKIQPTLPTGKHNMLKAWAVAWTVCGAIIIASLFWNNYKKEEYIMVTIFLLFWVYFEYKVLAALQWYAKGVELIRVQDDSFTYIKQINGRGFPLEDAVSNLKSFKYINPNQNGILGDINNSSWMLGGEVIEYEADGNVRRFGMKLPESDAKQLVNLLNKTITRNA